MWGGYSVSLLSDVEERVSQLGVSRSVSWTLISVLGRGLSLLQRAVCLLGYCTTTEIFAQNFHDLAIDAALDPHAYSYGAFVFVQPINTYMLVTQLNHGKGLDSSPSFKAIQAVPKVYSTNRLSIATDLGQDLSDGNIPGAR